MIPIQSIGYEDNPTKTVRAFVRKIAQEDGTTFAIAMRGYAMMVDYLRDITSTAKRHPDPKNQDNDPQEVARRIVESRRVLGLPLARAVRAFSAEALPEPFVRKAAMLSGTGRKCQDPKCLKETHPSSYYWCGRHMPLPESDDGDLNYCLPPPRSLGKVVDKGYKKFKRKSKARTIIDSRHAMVVSGVDSGQKPDTVGEEDGAAEVQG